MIRTQPSSSGSNQVLIGSDLKDRTAARREVDQWIARHRCRVTQSARHLSVFEKGIAVREWVLVERFAEPEPPAAAPHCILLVADDLMTPSRVREGARPLGFEVRVAATGAAAREAAIALPAPVAILVNLTARRYDPVAVITSLKADATTAT